MTNTRFTLSRNKREGWYAGKHRQPHPDKNWWEVKKRHRRTKHRQRGSQSLSKSSKAYQKEHLKAAGKDE